MQTLALLLILVPAPKSQPVPTNPIIGPQAIDWGHVEQTTTFLEDGTCSSPEFGRGNWCILEDGSIWFSERDGTAHYLMDRVNGKGWCVTDGMHGFPVDVRIRKGERLQMPREAK